MQPSVYKAEKEAFVAGHAGTTLLEINSVVGMVPLATLIYCSLGQRTARQATHDSSDRPTDVPDAAPADISKTAERSMHAGAALLAEFSAIIAPAIGTMMGVISPEWTFLCAALAAAALRVLALRRLACQPVQAQQQHAECMAHRLAQTRTQ